MNVERGWPDLALQPCLHPPPPSPNLTRSYLVLGETAMEEVELDFRADITRFSLSAGVYVSRMICRKRVVEMT